MQIHRKARSLWKQPHILRYTGVLFEEKFYELTRIASWAAASLLLRNSSNFCASLVSMLSAVLTASTFSAARSWSLRISIFVTGKTYAISVGNRSLECYISLSVGLLPFGVSGYAESAFS